MSFVRIENSICGWREPRLFLEVEVSMLEVSMLEVSMLEVSIFEVSVLGELGLFILLSPSELSLRMRPRFCLVPGVLFLRLHLFL